MSSGNNSSENTNGSDSNDHHSDEQKNSGKSTMESKLVSEPKNCPICLNAITNLSVTDVCFHEFCFECIREWSTQHNHCPTCRQQYSNILFNIRSDTDFEQMPVETSEETDMNAVLVRMFLFVQLIAIRNQIVDQRNAIDEQLRQLRRRRNGARCGNALSSIRQRLRNLQSTRDQMTNNINRLENTARILNPQQLALLLGTDHQNPDTEAAAQSPAEASPFDSLANNVVNYMANSHNTAGSETDDEDSEPETRRTTRRRRNTRRRQHTRSTRHRRNNDSNGQNDTS